MEQRRIELIDYKDMLKSRQSGTEDGSLATTPKRSERTGGSRDHTIHTGMEGSTAEQRNKSSLEVTGSMASSRGMDNIDGGRSDKDDEDAEDEDQMEDSDAEDDKLDLESNKEMRDRLMQTIEVARDEFAKHKRENVELQRTIIKIHAKRGIARSSHQTVINPILFFNLI
jgi:hypothetical protein